MRTVLLHRIDTWKKLLLDFGKRNRLINFKEGKRSNVKITTPSLNKLYELLVVQEKDVKFPYATKVKIDEDGEEVYEVVKLGNVETSRPIGDLQKTLRSLRLKSKISIEEMGVNTLYLTFGILKWKEREDSDQELVSPLVLVPVKLKIESISSPYIISLHDDEIVLNPTLIQKLDNDLGFKLPNFDNSTDDLDTYLEELAWLVENKGWRVIKDVHLTALSFLKINMYKDLERNSEKLERNPIIATIIGEGELLETSLDISDYDHDNKSKPLDTYQVVDADSSQQDAVLLSKRGTSFVLQGPPGTGKSQTITNIISEAMADSKKVLFVSEKMAALQVVHNRLKDVGLADFCLALHSHRANKKVILRDLSNAVYADRKRVRTEILSQLDILEKKRATLNNYPKELHTSCSSLEHTIYEVNGKLAKLEHIPEIIFEIINVDSTTRSELNDRCYLLSELSKTIGKRSEDYAQNVWRNANVDSLTNELRHDIDSNISLLLPNLNEVNELFSDCCKRLGLSIKPSLEGLDLLINLLSFVSKSPIIPTKWIFDNDLERLQQKAQEYKTTIEEITELQTKLSAQYCEDIFSFNGKEKLETLSALLKALCKELRYENINSLVIELQETLSKVSTLAKSLSLAQNKAKEISLLLGIEEPKIIADIKFIASLAGRMLTRIMPTGLWFDTSQFQFIKSQVGNYQTIHGEIIRLRQEVLAKYDKEIFEIDFYSMLKRLRGKYQSMFRIFNKAYRDDIRQIKQYLFNSSRLSNKDSFDILNKLKTISDKTENINNNKPMYIEYFGSNYNGLDTSWEQIKNDISTFEIIISNFSTNSVPNKLRSALLSQTLPYADLSELCQIHAIASCEDILISLRELMHDDYDIESKYSNIIETLLHIESNGNHLTQLYNEILALSREPKSYENVIEDLTLLTMKQKLHNDIEEQKQKIVGLFDSYYNGFDTNWDKIFEALIFTKEFNIFIQKHDLPKKFITEVCSDIKVVSYCKMSADQLSNLQDKINDRADWLIALFDESEALHRYHFKDLVNRISSCREKKYLLEEWVDYCSNRNKCHQKGLTTYISQVEERDICADYIVEAYLKRFYRLWLDAMLPNFPAVQTFRSRIHSQIIKEFKELDKAQLKIAQSRVRERVFCRMPDFNAVTSTRDEIGILKRELAKQRKLLPLRKLFRSIPNLITALKPCFMMSPLSVSVFLEAESYDFDMVIFDEASQVHTEDAIGAIMRAKQVIIVGDTKQLPPTNFFATSLNDENYDSDSEDETIENDAGTYQSILDESITVLPERSLRWHYRSRHEDLIAFSNIKIYNSSLITFPSSVEKAPDCGVEYVYVSNGIYDRGGKRNNQNEAKIVAEMVFDHYRKYPNRSLGVVTFSGAQMLAIDTAVRYRRQQNDTYESYFAEDSDEPFFIKNLENVQGDERDTIIFSIGYAKDSKGIMYMNFGPLSKEDGYRRLNVAITRAKHNIKLVGSILPTDIDTSKTSSEGVKLLRSYIEFAQQGISALQNELTYSSVIDFDSPFEEAVYDFLSAKGYDVVTQVGCSGFRIDMAIKHPTQSGKFAIGIECDGATYHSSRTARERDRLRQDVLECMGWTIYRIWSTDWIKDQRTEEFKLLEAIKQELSRTIQESLFENDDLSLVDTSMSIIELEEEIKLERDDNNGNGYRFTPYQLADIYCEEYIDLNFNDSVLKIIEIEQPIHFEELCKRSAPFFGNQKATSKVRQGIEYLLLECVEDMVERKGDFITLKGFNQLQVRIPNDKDNHIRPIIYISDDELGSAMITIAQHSFGVTPEDLFTATAREFGFKRTGEAIVTALLRAYNILLSEDKVKEIDGKVSVIK